MKKVYVVVLVTYDYYRFQENLAVVTSEQAGFDFIKLFIQSGHENYVTYLYEENSEHEKLHDETGICHYWLQEFNVPIL